jgi:transcriptional regulator with XRE-family HTH domain
MPKRLTLDEIRTRKGMTQEALAKASGVSRSTIAKLELGEHLPTQETLGKLATVLGEQVHRAKYGWRKVHKKRGRPRRREEAK